MTQSTASPQLIVEQFRAMGFPSARYPDSSVGATGATEYVTVYAGVAGEIQRAADIADDLNCWLVVTPAHGVFGIVPRA